VERDKIVIKRGIINPQISALLCRVRHTNMLVIADRAFPSWPTIETADISLTDGIPTVLQVLEAIKPNFDIIGIFMAKEFEKDNPREVRNLFAQATHGIPVTFEPHAHFKRRVPNAVGLIRTGDSTPFANMILVSGRTE